MSATAPETTYARRIKPALDRQLANRRTTVASLGLLPSARALDLRLRPGEVIEGEADDTLELEPDVYVDVDRAGEPIGIEFVDAARFLDWLARQGGVVELPGDVATRVAERLAS